MKSLLKDKLLMGLHMPRDCEQTPEIKFDAIFKRTLLHSTALVLCPQRSDGKGMLDTPCIALGTGEAADSLESAADAAETRLLDMESGVSPRECNRPTGSAPSS